MGFVEHLQITQNTGVINTAYQLNEDVVAAQRNGVSDHTISCLQVSAAIYALADSVAVDELDMETGLAIEAFDADALCLRLAPWLQKTPGYKGMFEFVAPEPALERDFVSR